MVNSLVEDAGSFTFGNFPDESEVTPEDGSRNPAQAQLGREQNNKLTWEVVESGVELNQEQKVSCTFNEIQKFHTNIQIPVQRCNNRKENVLRVQLANIYN